jgi:hypothetical protein
VRHFVFAVLPSGITTRTSMPRRAVSDAVA